MRRKSNILETPSERLARDIRRATRKQYSAEEKIRIVLGGLRGKVTIADLCRREGMRPPLRPCSRHPTYVASCVASGPTTIEWSLRCIEILAGHKSLCLPSETMIRTAAAPAYGWLASYWAT